MGHCWPECLELGGTSEADHTERGPAVGGHPQPGDDQPACFLGLSRQRPSSLMLCLVWGAGSVGSLGSGGVRGWGCLSPAAGPLLPTLCFQNQGRSPCSSQESCSVVWPGCRLHRDFHARWHTWFASVQPTLRALLVSFFADEETEAPSGSAHSPSRAELGCGRPATFTPNPCASCKLTSLAWPLGAQLSCVDLPALLGQASSLNVQADPNRTRRQGLDHEMFLA